MERIALISDGELDEWRSGRPMTGYHERQATA